MWYRFAGVPLKFFTSPVESGFYVGDIPIAYGQKMSRREWVSLLNTKYEYLTSQEDLNKFLSNPNRFEIIGNQLSYKRRFNKKDLFNFISEFYVGSRKINLNEKMNLTEWANLLSTDHHHISNQEKLNEFLSDPRRFEIKDGAYFYKPFKISNRESQFISKFNNYIRDSIYLSSQPKIRIFYKSEQNFNINKILKLDFAFMKNDKIVLAIEINGAQHYGFVRYNKDYTFNQWQDGLNNDILKINYCHDNNIPLLIFHHMLSDKEFKSILNNLHKNPHAYNKFIPQPVADNNVKTTSLEFIRRQIYSHLYPVFNGTITFENDEAKKRYIKDTLILISNLMGIYEGGIDKTDYINSFDLSTDLTANYNICLVIYDSLYPNFPLDYDEKITYSDLSKPPKLQKEKLPVIEPEENLIPFEE